MINFTPSASFTKSVMPIAQKMAQSATSAATAMKTGTSNLSEALMSKGHEALKTLATAFNSLCHSVSNSGAKVSDAMVTAATSTAGSVSSTIQTAGEQVSSAMGSVVTAAISTAGSVSSTIQTSGAKVSTAMGNAMPSGAKVSKTIDLAGERIAELSLLAEGIKITTKLSMKYAAPGLEHLGEVGQKALEGFEKAAPLLGTAIGVVSLAIGVKEAYKGINAYTRARNLDSSIDSGAIKRLTNDIETLPGSKTDKEECAQLLKDLTFSVENNYTRAGDKAKLAAIEIASGTIVVALYAGTGGLHVFGSLGIMAGTMAAKSLVTHHRGAQETTTLKEQRDKTTERLTKKLGEIQTKITTNTPLSQSDKLMLEALKSVGLLSKQTDVSGDLSTQSARGKIMTTLRGKQTVSDQLAAIKPNNLIHAFTKGADGIKESHESHSTAHATPHIQTERTAL